ncbi:MarR family transcriptional regulator [Actinoalloteichus sp. AHMU CJ021]|uniref:transcriptional regulator n=1 Tax=Actinoalloteichus sp. AHMU CJ021 TaxID=2072503 RepID=UPI000CA0849E|nr:MarR family transcriptional regulator [Actinoalloteichus sp. AHMU CJ021]
MIPTPPELDPVIHAQARLRVMATLSTLGPGDQITFSRLQELLDMTPGNLITHLRKLTAAGYVNTEKRGGRTSTTFVEITPRGKSAFDHYLAALHDLLTPSGHVDRVSSPAHDGRAPHTKEP